MSSTTRVSVVLALALLAAGGAMAQSASAPAAASAPRMGPGMGPGPGMGGMGPGGRGGMMRWGSGVTPGWSMMTPAERDDHRQKMRAAKTREECQAVMAEHHQQMVERAKERGVAAPPGPRRDPCAGLPAK